MRSTTVWLVGALVISLSVGVQSAQAAFPGQNGPIAFTRTIQVGIVMQDEIFTMNPNGTLQVNRTNNPANDREPAFSANGSKIAFVSDRDGNHEIYTMNADGTGVARVTNSPGFDVNPSFSPDGSKIVFVSHRDGNEEVYTVSADGSGATRLTSNAVRDVHPAFSPDGSKIAFASERDAGAGEIYTMSADGTGVTRLTNNASVEGDPAFSPDGSKIVFSDRDLTTFNDDVYSMNSDGTGRTRLTTNPAFDGDPAFSPDGSMIAFRSNRDNSDLEIYTMNSDGLGQTNRSSLPQVREFSPDWGVASGPLDTTPPETMITSGPSGTTDDNTPTFEFSSNEVGSSFACRVDTQAFASCTSPHTTAALSNGQHTFEVRATDAAGNVDPTPAARTFTVTSSPPDTTPPETTISAGPSEGASTDDDTPTFEFTSSEAGSTFQCRVDTQAFASCTSPYTTGMLSNGQHTFEVRATDAAGNTDASPAARSFTVNTRPPDTNPPETTITLGPAAGTTTNDNTPTFEFNSSEPGSSFACRVDAGSFAPCTSPHTTAVLSVGQHTFEVRATDAAGNTDPTPASRSFRVVDQEPPETTIMTAPSGTIDDNTPTFEFASSEAGSSFECRFDAQAFADCTSPHTAAPLGDGQHTFEVRATDAEGNLDPTPASGAFTVDAPDPAPSPNSTPSTAGPSGTAPGTGGGQVGSGGQGASGGKSGSGSKGGSGSQGASALAAEQSRSRGWRSCMKAARTKTARKRCLTRYGRKPGPITGLKARAASATSVVLTFRAAGTDGRRAPAARSYLVEQALKATKGGRKLKGAQKLCKGACRFTISEVGESITLTITDLLPKTTYYYAVAARDNVSGRVGPRSKVVSTTTK